MKLTGGLRGIPLHPDYEMLRTALIAAQAATPTARAATAAATASDQPIAAMHDLFTAAIAAAADASTLGNSFARNAPDCDGGQER